MDLINRIFNLFRPAYIESANLHEQMRWKFLVALNIFFIAAPSLAGPTLVFFYNIPIEKIYPALLMQILGLLNLVWIRQSKSLFGPSLAISYIPLLILNLAFTKLNGLLSPPVLWLPVFPILSYFLIGLRASLVSIGLLVLFGAYHVFQGLNEGYTPTLLAPNQQTLAFYVFSILTSTMSLIIVWLYDRSKLSIETRLDTMNKELRQASEKNQLFAKENKHQKEFLENLFDSMSDLMVIVSIEGCILKTNSRFRKVINQNTKSDATQSILDHLIDPDNFLIQSFESKNSAEILGFVDYPVYLKTNRGIKVPVSVSISPAKRSSSESGAFLLAARDLTESHLLLDLRETQQQLVQSAKLASLGEMTAGIAHELNNPLFAVQGFNEILRRRYEMDDHIDYDVAKKYLDRIDAGCKRMDKIIKHLRVFSRQSEEIKEIVEINTVIEDSFTLLQQKLRIANIRVEKNLVKPSPKVMANPNRLEQVLMNLFSNSIDAIREGKENKGQFYLKINSYIEEQRVFVVVKDNGHGIAPETIDNIFDPFFTTKGVGKGTGLGLSISHSIIQEHDGSIMCQSDKGEGATFKIILPLAAPNDIYQSNDLIEIDEKKAS